MTHDHPDNCNCGHSHGHEHAHEHAEGHGITGRKMGLAVVLTLAFVVGETIAGYFSRVFWFDSSRSSCGTRMELK